jgi:hypothetical protein
VSGCDGEEPTMCSGRPEEHLGGGSTEQTALGPRRVRVGRKERRVLIEDPWRDRWLTMKRIVVGE